MLIVGYQGEVGIPVTGGLADGSEGVGEEGGGERWREREREGRGGREREEVGEGREGREVVRGQKVERRRKERPEISSLCTF